MTSPYKNLSEDKWQQKTQELISLHPLSEEEIVKCVLSSWDDILLTKIAGVLQIGVDVFPVPQVMGNFLHELIPYKLNQRYPNLWRKDMTKNEKDLVYIPDSKFSIEIKTSSSSSGIFGNRSYGQLDNQTGKTKAGYYIAINFEPFNQKISGHAPEIKRIRFGWLDHTDWKAQDAATGQQSYVIAHSKNRKMKEIYNK